MRVGLLWLLRGAALLGAAQMLIVLAMPQLLDCCTEASARWFLFLLPYVRLAAVLWPPDDAKRVASSIGWGIAVLALLLMGEFPHPTAEPMTTPLRLAVGVGFVAHAVVVVAAMGLICVSLDRRALTVRAAKTAAFWLAYVLAVLLVYGAWDGLRRGGPIGEGPTIGQLRSLTSILMIYEGEFATYPKDLKEVRSWLESIGQSWGDPLENEFDYNGYHFTYTATAADADGAFTGFTVTARPLKQRPYRCRSYYLDQYIRVTREDRLATHDDPPL